MKREVYGRRVGELVKRWRRKRGWSKRQLAKALGYASWKYVDRLEKAEEKGRSFSPHTWPDLVTAFPGLTIEAIVAESDRDDVDRKARKGLAKLTVRDAGKLRQYDEALSYIHVVLGDPKVGLVDGLRRIIRGAKRGCPTGGTA